MNTSTINNNTGVADASFFWTSQQALEVNEGEYHASSLQDSVQIVYLDYDGAETRYENKDLGLNFSVTIDDSELSRMRMEHLVDELNENEQGILYVIERPVDAPYSTVYIGQSEDFDKYGAFLGLAETIDVGNLIKDDSAFVFADKSWNNELLKYIIDHEVSHLLGESHESTTGTIEDYAALSYYWDEKQAVVPAFLFGSDISETASCSFTRRWEGSVRRDYGTFTADRFAFEVEKGETLTIKFTEGNNLNAFLFTNSTASPLYAYQSKLAFTPQGNGSYSWTNNSSTRTVYLYVGFDYQPIVTTPGTYNINYTFNARLSGGTPTVYKPNLLAVKPATWSNYIVVSTKTNTTIDSSQLSASDTLYADFSWTNNGNAGTGSYDVQFFLDNKLINTVSYDNLSPSNDAFIKDINLGKLSAGEHTLKMLLDSGNDVNESNESNTFTRTFTVLPAANLAPTNLSGMQNGDLITLTWDAPHDASYFIFQYSLQSNFAGAKDFVWAATSLNAPLPAQSGNFYWRVKAVDDEGLESEWATSPESITIEPTIFPEINLNDSQTHKVSNGVISVTLSWSSPDEIAYYTLIVDGESYHMGTSTSKTLQLSDGEHTYSVTAVNKHGASTPSAEIRFSYDATAPTLVSREAKRIGNTVALSWVYSGDAAEYVVEYSLSSNMTNAISLHTTSDSLQLVDLSDGTYYWRLRAIDSTGNSSGWSPYPMSFSVESDVDSIDQASLSAQKTGTNVTFSWNASSDAFSYVLQYSDNADFISSTTISLSNTLYSKNIETNGIYYWRVRANDGFGNTSAWTYASEAVVIGVTVPDAVQNLKGSYSVDSISLQWSPSSTATEYIIEYSSQLDFSQATRLVSKNNEISIDRENLTPSFYWRVKTLDEAGNESPWSISMQPLEAEIPINDNQAPIISVTPYLTPLGNGQTELLLSWDSDDPSATYEITIMGKKHLTSQTNYKLTLNNGSYSYSVVASDRFGNKSTAKGSFVLSATGNRIVKTVLKNNSETTAGLYELGKLTVAAGTKLNGEQKYTQLNVNGGISGTDKNDIYSFGNYTKTRVEDNISLFDGNDSIRIGSYSEFSAGTIDFGTSINNKYLSNTLTVGAASEFTAGALSNLAKITLSTSKAGFEASFKSGSITGTLKADSYSFGNYSQSTINGSISLGDGNDRIKIGSYSEFTASAIDFGTSTDNRYLSNALSIGSASIFDSEDLMNLSRLTLTAGRNYRGEITLTVFNSAAITGTLKTDSYSLGNYSQSTIDGDISLGDGNDSIRIGSYSEFTVRAIDFGTSANDRYLSNALTMGAASEFTAGALSNLARITLSTSKAGFKSTFKSGAITGTVKTDSYSFGNYSQSTIDGDINLGDGNDRIRIGSYSEFTAGAIDFGTSTDNRYLSNALSIGAAVEFTSGVLSNLARITLSTNKAGFETTFKSKSITGTMKNDSYSFGNYSQSTIDGDISLGDGNDSVRIGSYSEFTAGAINFGTSADNKYLSNALSIGAASEFTGGALSNLARITLSTSKAGFETTFKTKSITGTMKNDSYSFGNYSETSITDSISMAAGNDSLKIGNFAILNAVDLNLGTGTNSLSIASSSRVELQGSLILAENAPSDIKLDKSKLSLGAASSLTIHEDLARLSSLTATSGKKIRDLSEEDGYRYEHSVLTVHGEVSGTANNDSYRLGNLTQINLRALDMGEGTDSLILGSDSEYVINATSVEKLSIGKNNVAYLNSELISMLSEKALAENTIYDIGSYSDALTRSLSEQMEHATLYQPTSTSSASLSNMETQLSLADGSGVSAWSSSQSVVSPIQSSYDMGHCIDEEQQKYGYLA